MLNLNETITAYDLAEALTEESGKFEVISPNGEKFSVTCKPGYSISNLRPVGYEGTLQPWRIRKVGELHTTQETIK